VSILSRKNPDIFDPFEPAFHPDRLCEPDKVQKPSKIFVCSMADLFGDWVPWEWIKRVLSAAHMNPQHTFQFLTKNPARYQEFNPWPDNCWLGTTVTNQEDADARVPELLKAQAKVRFVSAEPLLGEINLEGIPFGPYGMRETVLKPECWGDCACPDYDPGCRRNGGDGKLRGVDWLIIGAMTGPGSRQHQPKPEWAQSLVDQARGAAMPVFLKENLRRPEKIQEFPCAAT
jgi:protein gp37